MSSSDHNRPRGSFGLRLNLLFAAVVTCVSVVVFLVAYYLLAANIREQDQNLIEARLEVYQAWYAEGGLAGLTSRFAAREDSGKETFFVRVMGPGHVALFVNLPTKEGTLDFGMLERVNPGQSPVEWFTLPAAKRRAPWLIATTRLPDGQWLQVGKTTEAQVAVLEHFRVVFGCALALALIMGVAGGVWLTREALSPIRQLIRVSADYPDRQI